MAFTSAVIDGMLDDLDVVTTHASLHTADPGSTGAHEVSGGSYTRKAITWQDAAGGVKTIVGTIVFQVPAGTTITYVGTWSAASGGTFGGGGVLAEPATYAVDGVYVLVLSAITRSPGAQEDLGIFSVVGYGALGDGSTDDSAAVQAAIDAAAAAGGGLVAFGHGTYCAKLTIKTGVHLRGCGHKATILKLPNSSASGSDVIIGDDWAAQTGTDTGGGPYSWSIRDLSIDGNKANNASGGCGIKVYGRDFVLRDLRVRNCKSKGVLTEWATGFPGGGDAMESLWDNVKVHDCDGWGFDIQGPHDSFVDHCIAFNNAIGGFSATNKAHGTLFRTCHAWGTQAIAVKLGQDACEWVNGQAETVSGGNTCVLITANACKVLGGVVFNPDVADTDTIGIQVGDGSHNAYATWVDTQINTCGAAGLKFVGNAGGGQYRLMMSQPIGSPIVGTPDPSDVIDNPTIPGALSGSLGLNGEIVRNALIPYYTRHRGGLPDAGAQWVYLGRWSTYNGGQRIQIVVGGTSGYDAVPATVGRTVILASTGNSSPTPNIAGMFWSEGGTAAITGVKAKRVGSDQLKWDIYLHVADYVGATQVEVSTGTGPNPASWVHSGTASSDPGAASTTIAAFLQRSIIEGVELSSGHVTPRGANVSLAAGAQAASAGVLDRCQDAAGGIAVTTVASPVAGALATVTFGTPYTVTPTTVVLTPRGAGAVGLGLYISALTTTAMTISCANAPTGATSYFFGYIVAG